MIEGRSEHANAVIAGKIYVLGGLSTHFSGPDEIVQFDPLTNIWSEIGTMPQEPLDRSRHHFTIGSSIYGDEIWVVGGKTGNDKSGTNFVDVFNVSTRTWRVGPDLPEPLWGGPSVLVGDTLHAFSGARTRVVTDDFHFSLDLSDPLADWQSQPSVPYPRVHVAGASVGERIYLIGGELHHSHDGDTTTVQIYDTQSQSWSEGAELPLPRSHAEWATFTHEGEIWSVSGVDSAKGPHRGQSEIFIYNPLTDRWREFETELPADLVSPGAKIIDDTLYVFGGGVNDWFAGEMNTTYALSLEEALEGDFDDSGLVNAADFLMWQRGQSSDTLSSTELETWVTNYGTSMADESPTGEHNAQGVVDGADFLQWQRGATANLLSSADLAAWKENLGSTQRDITFGDFNDDGSVDGLDLLAWQRGELDRPLHRVDLFAWNSNFGNLPELNAGGDFNEDGSVDGLNFLTSQRGESPRLLDATDFAAWRAAFDVSGVSALTEISIPEPTSWLLLGISYFFWGPHRLSRNRLQH